MTAPTFYMDRNDNHIVLIYKRFYKQNCKIFGATKKENQYEIEMEAPIYNEDDELVHWCKVFIKIKQTVAPKIIDT